MGSRIAGVQAGIQYFYGDFLDSVSVVADTEGRVIQNQQYTPFGETIFLSNAIPTPPYRFTNQEVDTTTDLYYYGARYYDPTESRFLSRDPMGGRSPYAYVRNNPIRYVDPDGREEKISPFESLLLSFLGKETDPPLRFECDGKEGFFVVEKTGRHRSPWLEIVALRYQQYNDNSQPMGGPNLAVVVGLFGRSKFVVALPIPRGEGSTPAAPQGEKEVATPSIPSESRKTTGEITGTNVKSFSSFAELPWESSSTIIDPNRLDATFGPGDPLRNFYEAASQDPEGTYERFVKANGEVPPSRVEYRSMVWKIFQQFNPPPRPQEPPVDDPFQMQLPE
ncbi:MAG: RHS repeat-associated core domain-containing protein [Deltaproteobacteria bacterium]|nr:RHS repeat-associated core domain-containing protein [Deltaproteobacteria bacterium]